MPGKNLHELIHKFNLEIQKIANWFRANKMCVNTSKTTKGKKVDLQNLNVVFNSNEMGKPEDPNLIVPLERIHCKHPDPDKRAYKLLGVWLDENLSFNYHVTYLFTKMSHSLYCINRAKNFVDNNSLRVLYFALIKIYAFY
jgi:hypothetical protein